MDLVIAQKFAFSRTAIAQLSTDATGAPVDFGTAKHKISAGASRFQHSLEVAESEKPLRDDRPFADSR